jgi:leukotriene-A4 hydrolase
MNAVYGERLDLMDRVLGLRVLQEQLATLPIKDQGLVVDLRDRDPGEANLTVLQEKGRLFMATLESKFGRERFDAFLHGYFDHFAFQSVSTEQFVQYLADNLQARAPGLVSQPTVTAWIDGPGIPPDRELPPTDAFAAVDAVRADWMSGKTPAKKLDTRDWVTPQWRDFLDGMRPLSATQMADLDQAFGFTRGPNAQIASSWFLQTIRNQYGPARAGLEEYLQNNGRGALIVPLYTELMKSTAGSVQAKRVYKLARPGYHPQVAAAIDAIVHPDAEVSDE